MFFVFSKLLVFFIYPLSWILVFLVASLFVKKPKLKRRSLIIATALALIFSNPFLFSQFASRWDIRTQPLNDSAKYSCAIVLGGFSGEGAQKGSGNFNSAADRFIQGVKLYTTGKVSHILISSGNGALIHDEFEEADWVKTQLQEFKIPDSCILIENRSRNTIENAAFSNVVLKKNHLQPPYVLVTSAFHMRRSLGIFKKTGINVIPYSCNYMIGGGNSIVTQFIPDAETLSRWNIYTQELIGTLVNYFK
jgi:uncharacterized SAM-binding protein YcdF (DUF218 family)